MEGNSVPAGESNQFLPIPHYSRFAKTRKFPNVFKTHARFAYDDCMERTIIPAGGTSQYGLQAGPKLVPRWAKIGPKGLQDGPRQPIDVESGSEIAKDGP